MLASSVRRPQPHRRASWRPADLVVLAVASFLLIAASCGTSAVDNSLAPTGSLTQGDPVPDVIVVPASEGFAPELLVECGQSPIFPAGALVSPTLLSDSEASSGAVESLSEFLESGEGDWWPQDGYWALVNNDALLMLAHIGPDGTTTTLATEQNGSEGSGWEPSLIASGGSCPIRVPLPDGLGEVGWRENPDKLHDAESTNIHLLASGQACSSGQPMGDRLTPPQFVVTDDAIYIALVAYRPSGNQTCPGNPEEEVIVEIGALIGDRAIINARQAGGTLADYLPVSPCGHIDESLLPSPQPTNGPVVLYGPPVRTRC